MRLRQLAVVVFVALVVAGGYWVLSDAIVALNVPPEPTEPHFEERQVVEPPPLRETPPGMAERRGFWLRMLTTGDERDVKWAVTQLRRDGEASRAEVLAAAQRSLRSNKALVQQALEFLLADPREDCYPLARDVLESDDPHAVNRALLLLAELGTVAEPVAPRLATLAVEREYPIPQYAMTALAAIGTPVAESAANDAVMRMEPEQRAFGYVALAKMSRPGVVAFLKAAFESEEQPGTKLAAAEGLVRSGDETPIAWLRGELDRVPHGTPHFEGCLRTLALARDEVALRFFVRRAEDPLENGKRRANALAALLPYSWTRRCARGRHPRSRTCSRCWWCPVRRARRTVESVRSSSDGCVVRKPPRDWSRRSRFSIRRRGRSAPSTSARSVSPALPTQPRRSPAPWWPITLASGSAAPRSTCSAYWGS
jgi:hypothetical protein